MDRKEYLRNYQREWIKKRRNSWFQDKCCVKCKSTKNLELDHIDPYSKISNHIWSWSKERRIQELEKCQVLCYSCHKEKTKIDLNLMFKNKPNLNSRTISDEVIEKVLYEIFILKKSQRQAAKDNNITRSAISSILYQGVRQDILKKYKS